MKKVFIDLGANKGQSTKYALEVMMKGVEDYEIHVFETLPLLAERLRKYFKKNPRVHVYHAAAWIKDGAIKFYVSSKSTESGTVFLGKTTGNLRGDTFIKVPCIDFSKWIEENLSKDNQNILKFDIEGAEYAVLGKMIDDDNLNYFTEIHGEFHTPKMNFRSEEDKKIAIAIQKLITEGNIPYKYWDRSSYGALVDYNKGTRPSLASSKILDYNEKGEVIPYIEPTEDE